ncbi:hypothetical protein [uncultured Aquimarina sp.]|uniref:hypothetical protein n=1 Tax=uncultured Aquimarina sp. TaxID=575652 RepID=UPI002634CFE3|nr:hypothetical protein [uncultured Aquimarina sp.]
MEIVNSRVFFLVLTIILFISCSEGDNDITNQQPSGFETVVSEIKATSALLKWNESIDPQGSTVFYDVFLESVKVIDNTTDLTFAFNDLEENTSYTGEVVASDPEGNTVSESFAFETSLNQPPTGFSVSVNYVDPFYTRIEWNASVDPEGESIRYEVYLQNELIGETPDDLYYILPELKGLTFYSGKVIAFDESGKSEESQFSFSTGLKVYSDNPDLDTQDKINDFGSKGYNVIEDNLTIGSNNFLTNVIDLTPLKDIQSISGDLLIKNTLCTNLIGLENLKSSYQYTNLTIESNDQLINLDGLEGFSSLHEVYIVDNEKLTHIEGLSKLSSISNYISIILNPSLNSIQGLRNLESVSNRLNISNNDSLIALDGLQNIITTGEIEIIANDNLQTLNGLDNLGFCSSLIISENISLSDLTALSNLSTAGSLSITDSPSLISLQGLNNLVQISHTVRIARNSNLETLSGIENIVFPNSYHELVIWENEKITNLNPLENYTFKKGKVTIYFNSNLTDFCGITKLVTEIEDFINDYNFASNNGYNPQESDILNGNCSL